MDPFHRRLISPVSSLSVATRVRRRSTPLLPLGLQLIRGPQKVALPITVNDEPTKTNGIQSRKKERKSCLHQIQKGKSGKKRRRRKSVERGKLLDAAKKQIQLKENGKMLTTVSSPMSTLVKSRTQLREEDITTLPTALDLDSSPTAKLNEGHLSTRKGDKAKLLTVSTSVPALTVAADKSSTQSTKDDKAMLGSVPSVLLASAASSSMRRMQSKEDNMGSLALASNPITTTAKTTPKAPESSVIDVASSEGSVTDAPASQRGGTTSLNISFPMPEKGLKSLEPKKGEAIEDFFEGDKFESQNSKRVIKSAAEDTAVNDAPWLPRMVKTQSAPKKVI